MVTSVKKLHNKWAIELAKELRNIVWCERCGTTDFSASGGRPDIAHSMKRTKIGLSRELYFEAVKLCRACHVFVEYGTEEEPGTHERMKQLVCEIKAKRVEICW